MADGRLGQAEAVARGGEAAKIPNCEKDTQQIQVEMIISWAHAKNNYYEFDLVQASQHHDAMAPHFNTVVGPRMKANAGKLSSAVGLSTNRQLTDGNKETRNEQRRRARQGPPGRHDRL
ncbi:MAG: hypothetical protein ACREDC_07435 [Bradyrhizobium sp.]